MGKQFAAVATIHHSPAVDSEKSKRKPGSTGMHAESKEIPPGRVFDASAIGMSDDDVERLLKAGHIVAREDADEVRPPVVGVQPANKQPGAPSVTTQPPGTPPDPAAAAAASAAANAAATAAVSK